MKKNLSRYLFLTLALILLLCIDLSQFFFIGTLIAPFLLTLYCTLLFCPLHITTLSFLLLLQCLESFCFYNYFFLPLLYLAPLMAAARYLRKAFYPSLLYPTLFALIGITMQTYLIEGLFLQRAIDATYTTMKISATITLIISFSLTIKMWVERDNRM